MIRVGCILLLVATAMSGCTSGPAPEPDPVGRIDGAVIDHMLGPWGGVEVHLVEEDRWTTTTELGGFSFLDVPPGIHTVAVTTTTGSDRELVVVRDWEISQVILQVWDLPEAQPYVSKLVHRATEQTAMPGAICEDCAWRTQLREEKPVAVSFLAVWDPRMLIDAETHLEITLTDEEGRELAPMLDASDEEIYPMGGRMLRTVIPGDQLSDSNRIHVDVRFADTNLPHLDFQMETFLHLHYGMTDTVQAMLE